MLQFARNFGRLSAIAVVLCALMPAGYSQDEAPEGAPAVGQSPDGEAGNGEGVEATPESQGFLIDFISNPINLILLSAILFMFIVVRPQQRQYKELQKALADVKKNARIVTSGGIHGTVVSMGDSDTVVIRIDDASGAKLTINRDAIAKVVVPEDNKNKKPS